MSPAWSIVDLLQEYWMQTYFILIKYFTVVYTLGHKLKGTKAPLLQMHLSITLDLISQRVILHMSLCTQAFWSALSSFPWLSSTATGWRLSAGIWVPHSAGRHALCRCCLCRVREPKTRRDSLDCCGLIS